MWYSPAMPQSYTLSEHIDANPRDVHEWLRDWDHVRAWMGPTLVSIEMLSEHAPDEPMCVGMRFRETRKMGKMNAKASVEILRHEIDDQGVFRHDAVLDDGCNRMMCEYVYSPSGTGTDASFIIYNAPSKWWTRMMARVFGSMMIKMCAKHISEHLRDLKRLIENPDSKPAPDA